MVGDLKQSIVRTITSIQSSRRGNKLEQKAGVGRGEDWRTLVCSGIREEEGCCCSRALGTRLCDATCAVFCAQLFRYSVDLFGWEMTKYDHRVHLLDYSILRCFRLK